MSLVECCETVSEDIFGASDFQLNWLRNIIISDHFLLNVVTDTIKCFNFDVQIFLTIRKTKKSWS